VNKDFRDTFISVLIGVVLYNAVSEIIYGSFSKEKREQLSKIKQIRTLINNQERPLIVGIGGEYVPQPIVLFANSGVYESRMLTLDDWELNILFEELNKTNSSMTREMRGIMGKLRYREI
tara:strand:+ start:41 stop:400 length:360 start_codon:yes stop_codon:yes gene_type:complete